MYTLTTKDRHGVLCEGRIRRLTPRECLRLQGWTDDRIDTVLAIQSDNQAYKQAGNGVTVNVPVSSARCCSSKAAGRFAAFNCCAMFLVLA